MPTQSQYSHSDPHGDPQWQADYPTSSYYDYDVNIDAFVKGSKGGFKGFPGKGKGNYMNKGIQQKRMGKEHIQTQISRSLSD